MCLFDELVYLLKAVGSDEEAGSQLPLFLTGHSLGGAIASVFAAALQVEVRLIRSQQHDVASPNALMSSFSLNAVC